MSGSTAPLFGFRRRKKSKLLAINPRLIIDVARTYSLIVISRAMNTSSIAAKFQRERKKLIRELARVDGVLQALGKAVVRGIESASHKKSHSASARKRIGAAKRKWWKERKAALKAAEKK